MANKIRGITVQIGGDTSGLEKSLKDVNKEVKSTQAQLKDVEKLLKLDPTNTELLAQKQELLRQRVEQTTEKLNTLKDMEAQLKAAGVDENSEQFLALNREIISTQEYLKQATDEAKAFSAASAEIAASFDSVSEKAADVAEKTKGLSVAAGGALAGIAGMAVKAAGAADDLNTLSKQTGISTDELQKFQYASDLVDVSVDSITGGLKKLKQGMASGSKQTEEAFAKIGVSVRDVDGSLRDVDSVFYETLEGLSRIQNETERDAVAMQLFGKSADQLAGIIDDGGKALKEYGDRAEELGVVLDQETLDRMNAVNDQLDELKARASATFTKEGAAALEALTPIINMVVDALGNLLGWLGSLNSMQIGVIAGVLAVVAAISPVASIISKITGAIGTFVGFLPTLSTGLSAVFGFLQANPLVIVAAAVVALVAIIIANWDKIKPVLEAIWETVKKVFGNIKDFVLGVIEGIKEAFKAVVNFFTGILNKGIDGINFLIKALNKLSIKIPEGVPLIGGKNFGFNIPELDHIPMLANGGTVTSGSAIVGEAGAELLTVANGRAQVQPLTNNYTTNNYTTASNSPIEVELTLDGATLARQMVHHNANASRLAGGSCIYG